MRIILIGQPGSGKGTQSKIIATEFNIKHLSTGDILRQAIKNSTPLGLEAKKFMSAGNLVPDDVIIKLLNVRIKEPDSVDGFVLDGYPRTIAQAKDFDKNLSTTSQTINSVIYLHVSNEVLLDRLTGRRISALTGREYHLKYKPPKISGRCDIDGSELIQRDDDKPERILNRIQVFQKQTAPLIEYYQAKGKLKKIDAERSPEQVSGEILNYLRVQS